MHQFTSTCVVILLAAIVIGLQIQSSFLYDVSASLSLVQDEVVFLQRDLAADSLLVQEYLETHQSSDLDLVSERKDELDGECATRRAHFEQLLVSGSIDGVSVQTYTAAREVHGRLESLKDAAIEHRVNAVSNLYDGEEQFALSEQYQDALLEVSRELETHYDALSEQSAQKTQQSSRNSFLSISLSLVISLLAVFTLWPRRQEKLLSERELQVIGLLRRNAALDTRTTIKDVKRACGITHPTAQTLLNSLEERNLLGSEKHGREKHLFLREF